MTETATQTGKRNRLVGDPRTPLGIDLKTRYEQGATISGLAQATGYSYGSSATCSPKPTRHCAAPATHAAAHPPPERALLISVA